MDGIFAISIKLGFFSIKVLCIFSMFLFAMGILAMIFKIVQLFFMEILNINHKIENNFNQKIEKIK